MHPYDTNIKMELWRLQHRVRTMYKESKEAEDLIGKGHLEGLGTESSPKTNLAYILTKICVHETEYLSSFP